MSEIGIRVLMWNRLIVNRRVITNEHNPLKFIVGTSFPSSGYLLSSVFLGPVVKTFLN